MELIMAPRAYWKGYLKLSLVSCPIALFPATSEREKISFHQINKDTGHRIKYRKVDAETSEEEKNRARLWSGRLRSVAVLAASSVGVAALMHVHQSAAQQ